MNVTALRLPLFRDIRGAFFVLKIMNKDTIYYTGMDDVIFLNACKRRRVEAEGHWDKKSLKNIRKKNNEDYLAKYVEDNLIDERYQEVYVDNRQFTSVRTIVPFLTARVTAAEVTPASGEDLSLQFAEDFEESLQKYAEKEMGRAKIRLAVQDVLRGERVGILKWRYDGRLGRLVLEHVPTASVIIGKRGRQFEEPDYLCHTLERSVADLLGMFPDKAAKIKELFGITKGTLSQLETIYEIREEWLWVDVESKKQLVVGWSWQEFMFGKIKDPNWNDNGKNVIDQPMMPFIFFNFLNDGSGYIDQTSFMEQARWLQRNYNKRGQTIAENAKYGGTGVPIFAKGAISQKDVAKIRFSPIQRVLLDSADVGKAFTVWQSTPLPQYIVDDKLDDRNSIDNIWGTPNIFRGEQSKNNTLGQDEIVRNQAEGRLADPIDCIADSMTRFYQIEAQLMYRYCTEKTFINFLGNDGKFVSLAISSEEIAKNVDIQISVKAGTNLPIDRAQRVATAMELMKMNKIGTLTAYKILGIFDDPEAAYKEFILEQTAPQEALAEVDKKLFDREAHEDLMVAIGGEDPEEREDVGPEYLQYLNDWLLTDKYMLLQQKNDKAAARVSQFIDRVTEKAQRKINKMQMQPQQPEDQQVPPEVAAMVAQQSGQQPPPGAPAATPQAQPAQAPVPTVQ